MTWIWWLLGGIAWVGCGVLAYGLTFAHFQRFTARYSATAKDEFLSRQKKEADGRKFAIVIAFCGPVGLFGVLLGRRPSRFGVRFKSYTLAECAKDVDRCRAQH